MAKKPYGSQAKPPKPPMKPVKPMPKGMGKNSRGK